MAISSFPLVSVIVPTYNQTRYLPEALDSVLQQTYPSIELIIIDDGSTDETSLIGKRYEQDSRVHWIEQINQGPAHARNQGIAQAQGDYICLLDSDDIMHVERIAKQYEAFQKNPSIDIVYTALELIDSQGHSLGIMRGQEIPPPNFLALMLFRNLIPTSSVIMAKSQCLKQHPYHPIYKHAEDYELMLRLAHLFHFYYLDLPLIRYRRHQTNLSNNLEAHRATECKVLQKYSRSQIEQIVNQTTFPPEEKMLLKGRILFNQEHFEDASVIFKQMNSSLALFYQGNCYLRLHRPSQALQAYQQALAQDQTHPACYNNLGVAYALEGKLDQAKECFRQALALNKGYLDAQFNLNHPLDQWRVTWRELRPTLLPYITHH
jgi:glycosyltransferase involved in cell wall biosynthesis